jgi:hypothetical protein
MGLLLGWLLGRVAAFLCGFLSAKQLGRIGTGITPKQVGISHDLT